MAKIRKPSTVVSSSSGVNRGGIFGVNKPVATRMKVAGGSNGYDPFTKSIGHTASKGPTLVPKNVYVGHGGGKTGAGSGR